MVIVRYNNLCRLSSISLMHSHTEATVANPNTSEEAKEHSRQVIEDIQGGEYEAAERTPSNMTYDMINGKDAGNVLRGHKVGYRFCLLPDIGLSVDPPLDRQRSTTQTCQTRRKNIPARFSRSTVQSEEIWPRGKQPQL